MNRKRSTRFRTARGFTLLLLYLAAMCALPTYTHATAQSQQSKLADIYITLNLNNQKLVDVFQAIEGQTDFSFAYPHRAFNESARITVVANNQSLRTVLEEISLKAQVGFKRINGTIHVSRIKNKYIPPVEELISPQAFPVSGKVTDANGEELPGVSIIVKGTNNGTVTDIQGNYSLNAPSSADTLVVSSVGYATREVPINGRSTVDISLEEDVQSLSEVVVVGYGTQRKSDLTGSVALVQTDEAKKVATNDISQLLQGRAAGVSVTSDGQPGAGATVRIRGISSFNNNEPLYVVDGVPLQTGIRDFNPNDIESIQVLKDASAGAIYGSRAANGVVIITTKRGRKDQPLSITYNGYYGTQNVPKRIPVTNREQYQAINNEMRINGGSVPARGNDPTSPVFINDVDTDWQEEGLKTGHIQNHNVSFAGGGQSSSYNVSLDYFDNVGVMVGKGPDYKRYSFRVNSETEKGILKVGESFYYTHSDENTLNRLEGVAGGALPPQIVDLIQAIPTMPVYDPNRLGGYGGSASDIEEAITLNVIGQNSLVDSKTGVDRVFANFYTELKLIDKPTDHLKYRLNLSYDRTNARDFTFIPEFDLGYFYQNAFSRLTNIRRDYVTALVENTLTYDKTFGKSSLNVLVGQTYQSFRFDYLRGYAQRLTKPYFPVLDNGEDKAVSGYYNQSRLASFLGRVNFSYDDRYLITATLRRDGSSRFGPTNRWGNFPSVAVAWKLQNESFLNLPDFINELKLRGGYGVLGNQEIGDYLFQGFINPYHGYSFNNVTSPGATQTRVVDPNIKWESKITSNIGLDAVLFNRRIDFSAEYYYNKSEDLLTSIPIPGTVGSIDNVLTTNAASMRNSGVEFTGTYRKTSGDFTFEASANVYTLSNKVLSLGENGQAIYGTGAITEVGSEIGQQYGYQVLGIFQTQDEVNNHAFQSANTAPGDLIFADLDTNGIINDEDRTYLGSALPNLYYGFNFSAAYKNFDFTFFASGSSGNLVINNLYRSLMQVQGMTNYHTDMLDRWTPANPDSDIPRVVLNDPNNNMRDSDRAGWLQSGNYLRVNTVSLGYNFPEAVLSQLGVIDRARVYFTCQNLYTFTTYKGFNPDFAGGVFNPGYDWGSFPKPRTLMLGAQLTF
ncbi:TonB-linked outer membrane protein, SusC/RagA family [Catalinimonas alkaloidigena]|uniref:TonB-linked outer membrane protein, SusC/RagA family n=1 Tax=Catalinimonas alkaloidigena TaxID=1075417 RepID=A0A1G9S6X9_9BACT|nr:TonB-dependent receptor [Catalinimonas alkaloidigena]SDM31246.1 TonB-linked outer membrane protein, SusC/RagA family [Catalinimonas alkaloidigena]